MNWKALVIGGGVAAAAGALGWLQVHLSLLGALNPVYVPLIAAAIGAILHALPTETSLASVASPAPLTTSAQK
jgi:hypothetical protein